jgi:subfamily B ATP-binding cassette protein MsbA
MKLIRRSIKYFFEDKWLIAWLFVIVGLLTIIELVEAWPAAILMDLTHTEPHTNWVSNLLLSILPPDRIKEVVGLALIFLISKVSQIILTFLHTVVETRIDYNGDFRAKCELFQKLQDLGVPYNRQQSEGDLVYRLNEDSLGCSEIFKVVVETLTAGLSVVAAVWIMITVSPIMTLICLSITPIVILTNLYFSSRVEEFTNRAKEADTSLYNCLVRSIGTMPVVHAFLHVKDEIRSFANAARGSANGWQEVVKSEATYNLIIDMVYALAASAVFAYGGVLAVRGELSHAGKLTLSGGEVLVFLDYLNTMWLPLCRFSSFNVDIAQGLSGAKRLFEILDREPEAKEPIDGKNMPIQPRTIVLNDVRFGYSSDMSVLNGISLEIPPGRIVAVVGESGCGKSTLVNLLPRFDDPTSGSIMLDQFDLSTCKLDHVRGHFACAFQEALLFPTSLYENIAYGRPNATRADVQQAAVAAGAAGFIDKLPKKYETILTEHGHNLSVGQRQRIALARTFLSQAPILIFDEPTNHLDSEKANLVMNAIFALRGQRTIILVTHDLGWLVDCDEIIVLRNGMIEERGDYAALMAKGGHFRHLVEEAEGQNEQ